jgi:S1-C subfamily serine protease
MEAPVEYGSRRTGPALGAIVSLAILFGLLAGFGGSLLALWAQQEGYVTLPLPTTTAETGTRAPLQRPRPLAPRQTFADIAENLNESVVNINTLARQEDPMAWFFGRDPQQEVKGLGTGIIVDVQGYILTNFHVVGDADNIKVTVMHADGKREYDAKFIGGDKQEDLAVIKISGKGLRPMRFGNSDLLRPGDDVMAIGNPFGFEHTVSVGVVSALNRRLPVDDTVTLKGMIQTDASINPGNSGGPLVNTGGELVGINSAIFVGNGQGPQANGIGFSIPSNHAQRVMKQLRANGKVQHPYVGIRYEFVSDEVRREERLPVKSGGVIVRSVFPKGPADKAGVKPDDLLKSVDGKTLTDENTLGDYISKQPVGKILDFELMRWNELAGAWTAKRIRVKIEDMPRDFMRSMNTPERDAAPEGEPQPQAQPQQRAFPFPFPF